MRGYSPICNLDRIAYRLILAVAYSGETFIPLTRGHISTPNNRVNNGGRSGDDDDAFEAVKDGNVRRVWLKKI